MQINCRIRKTLAAGFSAILFLAFDSAEVCAAGLGKVIYARREGSGVLVHAEGGDLHVSFPVPTVVRICEPALLEHNAQSLAVDTTSITPYASFESLDPRFQTLQSEALRVEMGRDPFTLKILDVAGNLLLEVDGPEGLSVFNGSRASLKARYDQTDAPRGFGLNPRAPQTTLNLAQAAPPDTAQGLYLSPSPFGRLNDRCAIALRPEGQSTLSFAEPGTLDFSSGGALEAFVCLATTDQHYWTTMQFLFGRSMFVPQFLLGTGYTLSEFKALAEVRGIGARLSNEGFDVDWLLFPSTRPGLSGWNQPYRSLNPNPTLWGNSAANFEALEQDQIEAVLEVPSGFSAEAQNVSMTEFLKDDQDKEEASSAPVIASSIASPFDYGVDKDAIGAAISALAGQGFARWMVAEDERPSNAAEQAMRPAIRAGVWHSALVDEQNPARERRFVLDREMRADLNRRNYLLAPWRIDPMSTKPSDAFALAGSAALSGLPTWGLDLPITLESYPSKFAMQRWFQTALIAPYVLLRAPEWDKASPPVETADINNEFRRLFAVRERLRPWMYSLARTSSLSGVPICRPVEQSEASTVALAVGPDTLFVAPDPSMSSTAKVDLPEGDWIDLNTNEAFRGGQAIESRLDSGRFPAYARRGAFIPYWGIAAPGDASYFVGRLYPSSKGEFALYEDAGDGLAYLGGEFAVTQFNWKYEPAENVLEVTIAGPLGEYAPEVSPREMLLQIHSSRLPLALFVDEKPIRRTTFVKGSSKLLEASAPLQFTGPTLSAGATWDHDGSDFLYVWLPERERNTRVRVFMQQSTIEPGAADF